MTYLTIVVHIILAISLIALVLLQQGKGAEAGAAFGGGASQTVFGSRGSTGFLAKLTGVLVLLFFITSLALATFAHRAQNEARAQLQPATEQSAAADSTSAKPTPVASENKSAKSVDEAPSPVDNAAPVQDKAPAGSRQ